MVVAALGVFAPIALASLALDWGIVGVWCGLVALMIARLGTLGDQVRARALGRGWRARVRRGDAPPHLP